MPIPNTIEEIDTELQALARARIRPWGGYDRTANVRLNSRFNELLNRKKSLKKYHNLHFMRKNYIIE